MPRIALAPLFLIWFGLGHRLQDRHRLQPHLLHRADLARWRADAGSIPITSRWRARSGPSDTQIFRKFVLPSAVPVIFNGLRLGLMFALLGVVGGEIIASEHGLGQTLTVLAASFKTSGVFAVIILLAIMGVGISWGMTSLENRLLGGDKKGTATQQRGHL